MFEMYRQAIAYNNIESMSDEEVNALIELIANCDSITNEEYFTLYCMILDRVRNH